MTHEVQPSDLQQAASSNHVTGLDRYSEARVETIDTQDGVSTKHDRAGLSQTLEADALGPVGSSHPALQSAPAAPSDLPGDSDIGDSEHTSPERMLLSKTSTMAARDGQFTSQVGATMPGCNYKALKVSVHNPSICTDALQHQHAQGTMLRKPGSLAGREVKSEATKANTAVLASEKAKVSKLLQQSARLVAVSFV